MDHLTGYGLTGVGFYGLKRIFLQELWAKARIQGLRTI
jgi:hypothetical protein